MTTEQRSVHERAVKLKKMTDEQLCAFLDRTCNEGMKAGAGQNEAPTQSAPDHEGGAAAVSSFIDWLDGRKGTANRIGPGTILALRRELENARAAGIFEGI